MSKSYLILRLDGAIFIGQQQAVQIRDFFLDALALIRIPYGSHLGLQLNSTGHRLNILVIPESLPDISHILMLQQAEASGIKNQGIAGDARLLVVSPAEASINAQCLAICLDRSFPLGHLHRHMAIDDMAFLRV